jgi:hypothetical protein
MKRREVLQLLAGAALSSAIPRELWAFGAQVHQQVKNAPGLRTLNPHQDAIVATAAELIIPETETPGAKGARVNEFIDIILTDWYDEARKQRFLDGLADMDARCSKQFGRDFLSCSATQQAEILKALDLEVAAARESLSRRTTRKLIEDKELENHPFYMMKRLTLIGYYTSQVGAEQEAHFEIIPSQRGGCVPVEDSEKASGR